MRTQRVTALPIRVWLGLALVAVVGVPLVAMTAVAALAVRGAFAPFPGFEGLRADVMRDVARWEDPAWQAALTERTAGRGITVLLRDADGTAIYGDPTDVLMVGAELPPLPPPGEAGLPHVAFTQPITRLTVVQDGQQIGTAHFVFGVPQRIRTEPFRPSPWQQLLFEMAGPSRTQIALAGGITFVLTTAFAAWLIGRAVLVPLAAMGAAARRIAAGDLDFSLPPARVSEVAAAGSAFRAMADGLRDSVYRQAEVEGERRLFITAIVHDLRTPLFSLRGYLEGLATGVARSPERAAEYLGVCREKVAALDRLIADLFTYARVEYLEQAPERAPLDVGELLRRAAEGFAPQAAARNVRLALDGPDDCPTEGDAHMLGRAAENLLDNAVRHTPEGGTITLRWRCDAGGVRFSVADTGAGIPPADLPHLFAPLYRGEASRSRQTGGAGLGLTIARRVLLAHGGDLVAANQPGSGAIFTATLPGSGGERRAASSERKEVSREPSAVSR